MTNTTPFDPIAGPKDTDGDLAAEVIRNKIDALYREGDDGHSEPSAKLEEDEVEKLKRRSKHQQYMYNLSRSGKSLAEIQTEWHKYYAQLPDDEKHEVWQEFYKEHARANQQARQHSDAAPDPAVKQPEANSQQTVGSLKKQLLGKVNKRTKAKLKARHQFQSILFGLGVGSIVVLVLLFGFFNERIIAPFITPSRTVSNTPIINDNSGAVSNNPEVIIPKINVEIPVVYDQTSIDEAAVESSLEQGVVHYATTPSPGEKGNSVIFGHSSNNILNKGKYKFAFVLLNRLQVGDTFTLTKNGKRYTYQVYERKIVPPTDVSVLGSTDKPATATLITCDPPGTSINRLIVIGEQISPDPNSNGTSTAIKADGTPKTLPSNSPSLWHRLTGWISS